jgi:predicted RNA polymerase sigma factor
MHTDEIFRAEYGRILATLIRLLGDFDGAEEAAASERCLNEIVERTVR